MKLIFMGALGAACLFCSGESNADACGDDYQLIPDNIVSKIEPDRPCLKVGATGSSQPGCDQIAATVTNDCAVAVVFSNPGADWTCRGTTAADTTTPCSTLQPGQVLKIPVSAETPGAHTLTLNAADVDGAFVITDSFDVVENESGSGCSASGSRPPWQAAALLLGLTFAARLPRRARRIRESMFRPNG